MKAKGANRAVSPEEFWAQLHAAVTGREGEKSSTVSEYDHLTPHEGLKKAKKYYKWAKSAVDGAHSDEGYWLAEGDKAVAAVLVAFFKRLEEGQKGFQPLVVNGVVLMDKQANLKDWAVQTVSNHRHTWESCSHRGVGSKGSHPKCKTICEFGGLEHDVCSRCGLEKHSSDPLEKVVYE